MAQVSEQEVLQALRKVNYPGYTRDIVSFGLVDGVNIEGAKAQVRLRIKSADPQVPKRLKDAVEAEVAAVPGVEVAEISVAVTKPAQAPGGAAQQQSGGHTPEREPIPGVKHVVAIASGKGGVGKSTVSVNLACALEKALREKGKPGAVGIMDCDLYGPSVPLMMGIASQPEIRGEKLLPVENFNIRVMSIGLLVDEDSPVVWRGPLITKAIRQFAADVDWGELEVIIVDLPPGTGDTQLSMAQILPLDGALVVTTPQQAAVKVATRGARMFEKVEVPLLGVVENMSYMVGPNGERMDVFGEGGGAQAATALGARYLGQIPLEPEVRQGGDNGIPIVLSKPTSPAAEAFTGITETLLGIIGAGKG